MVEEQTNKFFDITKFPQEEGIIVFPISMGRASTEGQSAKTYMEYIEHINPSKIDKSHSNSKVGAIFIYTDFLYLYSDKKASELKKKFMNQLVAHKNNFQNLLKGHPHLIHDAVSSIINLWFGKPPVTASL